MNAYADSISTGKWFGEKRKDYVFEDSSVWEPAHVLFKLRAADAGNPNALFDLARMFERGVLDPARCGYEPGIVLECYERAARGGSRRAQLRLAQAFRLGELSQKIDSALSAAWEQPLEPQQRLAGFPVFGAHESYLASPTTRFASLDLKALYPPYGVIDTNWTDSRPAELEGTGAQATAVSSAEKTDELAAAARIRLAEDAAHLKYMNGYIDLLGETPLECAKRIHDSWGYGPWVAHAHLKHGMPAACRDIGCGVYNKEIVEARSPDQWPPGKLPGNFY